MQARDLLATAEKLVGNGRGRDRQSDLRRAVSTAYYALFHCIAETGANLLVGQANRKAVGRAWSQVYRSLEHGVAASACRKPDLMARFPTEIQDFANTLLELQQLRNLADYDPRHKFKRSSVKTDIDRARRAIDAFNRADPLDRKAFCIAVMFKAPRQA